MTKTPRRSRDETRQLVLDAALDLIRREGLGAEPTTVTYQRVFDYLFESTGVRVTRSSVHEQIWSSQNQFQHEVLLLASQGQSGAVLGLETAIEVLAATEGQPPWDRIRELCRVVVPTVNEFNNSDQLFFSWVGMTMSLAKDARLPADRSAELGAATDAGYDAFESSIGQLISGLAAELGFRPVEGMFPPDVDPFRYIAGLGVAMSEGFSLRTRFAQNAEPDQPLRVNPDDDEPKAWSRFAAGYWALLRTFLEVDPDVHPDADAR